MNERDIVLRIIAPADPALARRILSLLWSYERGQLRHRLQYQPLRRRQPEEPPATTTDANATARER